MQKAAKPIKDKSLILDIQEYLKYKNERDYVLFVIGITTGYRSQDLVSLRIRDIQKAIKEREFSIIEKKKDRNARARGYKKKIAPRIVPVQKALYPILRNYIREKKSYEYAFKSRKGNKYISVDSYGRILREAGQYFGLNHISAHTPRKIYACNIYEETGDLEKVKMALGHTSSITTAKYLGIDRNILDEISRGLNGLVLY